LGVEFDSSVTLQMLLKASQKRFYFPFKFNPNQSIFAREPATKSYSSLPDTHGRGQSLNHIWPISIVSHRDKLCLSIQRRLSANSWVLWTETMTITKITLALLCYADLCKTWREYSICTQNHNRNCPLKCSLHDKHSYMQWRHNECGRRGYMSGAKRRNFFAPIRDAANS